MATASPKDYDPRNCQVCHEEYDECEHRPRLLQCTHTFCSKCIDQIISISGCEAKCPVCCTSIEAKSSAEITLNRIILDFVQMQNKNMSSPVNPRKKKSTFEIWQEVFNDENNRGISFALKGKASADKIIDKNEKLKAHYERAIEIINIDIIPALTKMSDCYKSHVILFDKDTESLRSLSKRMDQEQQKLEKINREIKALHRFSTADFLTAKVDKIEDKLDHLINQLSIFMFEEENKHSTMIKETEEAERNFNIMTDIFKQELQQRPLHVPKQENNMNVATYPSMFLERIINSDVPPRKLTVADIKIMSDALRLQIQRRKVYASHVFVGKQRIGRLSLTNDEELVLHNMTEAPLPYDSHVIKFSNLMQMVDLSSCVTFIEFETEENNVGRVMFCLTSNTKAGREFFSRCSGVVEESYAISGCIRLDNKGDNLNKQFHIYGGKMLHEVYWKNELQNVEYRSPQVAGTLRGGYDLMNNFIVDIFTKDNHKESLSGVFGKVAKGLCILEHVTSFVNVIIKDSGVVIPLW